MTPTVHTSDFILTTNTPFLTLTGELWGAYYENFEENGPCNNGTTLEAAVNYYYLLHAKHVNDSNNSQLLPYTVD